MTQKNNSPSSDVFGPEDKAHMAEALRLAERGLYSTMPNPRVGCVIVRNGQIVGRGWHRRAGEAHAEVDALAEAGAAARGGVAYVTLEPCAHQGRTPPCAEALIAAGIRRVVAAMADPNPLVSGRGLARLKAAEIETQIGLLENEARELNIGFVSRMTRGRPWVRVKIAASLDGGTALSDGRSQWITGTAARQDGHYWRARACAILTGMGTIRQDDPRLDAREVATPRQPLKVVIGRRPELSPAARLFESKTPVLVVSSLPAEADLAVCGAECLCLPDAGGRVDLRALLETLGQRGINEAHVEAGRRLSGALLQAGLADELLVYLAPRLLGESAQAMFGIAEPETLDAAPVFRFFDIARIGEDLRLRLRPSGVTDAR